MLPKVKKPAIDGEATGVCSRRTYPGWLGAARDERVVRNLGDPAAWAEPNAERGASFHFTLPITRYDVDAK